MFSLFPFGLTSSIKQTVATLNRRSHTLHKNSFVFCLRFLSNSLSAAGTVLVMEYASRGNLLTLLRGRRGMANRIKADLERLSSAAFDSPQSQEQHDGPDYANPQRAHPKLTQLHSRSTLPQAEDLLRPRDVFKFGRQIARGMEFLASRKVGRNSTIMGL